MLLPMSQMLPLCQLWFLSLHLPSITSISCSQFLYYHIMQEAVAVTTAIQEEIFLEMGVGKSVL